jgi:thiamine pyrophosphokinase
MHLFFGYLMKKSPPTFALIANGNIQQYETMIPLIKGHSCIIAVDGGIQHCHQMNLTPDMIIGDLDSAREDVLKQYLDVPIRKFPTHKDKTDLELALELIYKPEVEKITLFGALGKRTDHTLSNLHLIRRYPFKVFIESEIEVLFAFEGKIEIPCTPGQTISFIHLGNNTKGVTSKGLKWEMENQNFNKNNFSISNVCLTSFITISIKEGDLLCCLQKLENNSALV